MKAIAEINRSDIRAWVDEHQSTLSKQIYEADELVEHMRKAFLLGPASERGYYTPWRSVANLFRLRTGEITFIHGAQHEGKSGMVNTIQLGLIEQEQIIASVSPEYSVTDLMGEFGHTLVGRRPRRPEYADVYGEWADGYHCVYDLAVPVPPMEMAGIVGCIVEKTGAKFVFIDNMTTSLRGSNDLDQQGEFMKILKNLCKLMDIGIIVVAHDRKKSGGDSKAKKNAGPTSSPDDSAGSSDLIRVADNILSYVRAKGKEERLREDGLEPGKRAEIEGEPDGMLFVNKQRYAKKRGARPFWFDEESNQARDKAVYTPLKFKRFDALIEQVEISSDVQDPFSNEEEAA